MAANKVRQPAEYLSELMDMEEYSGLKYGLGIDLAYQKADHPYNIFGKVYNDSARLKLHISMADTVMSAAESLYKDHGYSLVLYDGLRTVEAQKILYEFPDKRTFGMLAKPGKGGHPKGMAIDLAMVDKAGKFIDTNSHFDDFDEANAHRDNQALTKEQYENRIILETAMVKGALDNDYLLCPLPNEWWDYRFPEDFSDLWRFIASIARCLGEQNTTAKYKGLAFKNYEDFESFFWKNFSDKKDELFKKVGLKNLPQEKMLIYHGAYAPVADGDIAMSVNSKA